MVQTTVLPVATTFFTAHITIAAALASRPDVGSSRKIIDGLETSSTAIVRRFRCSVDKPLIPGNPTSESLIPSSSIVSRTSFINSCIEKEENLGALQFQQPIQCQLSIKLC